jgi:hypothetical protein
LFHNPRLLLKSGHARGVGEEVSRIEGDVEVGEGFGGGFVVFMGHLFLL